MRYEFRAKKVCEFVTDNKTNGKSFFNKTEQFPFYHCFFLGNKRNLFFRLITLEKKSITFFFALETRKSREINVLILQYETWKEWNIFVEMHNNRVDHSLIHIKEIITINKSRDHSRRAFEHTSNRF